ncbi:OLC1v1007927C1 [Oldenlandia corymbosa var. corymbosa]|uniref:OLC1v1007927C1 n=1 Tax=Oldenlandia corymbosa var. corymbosa TaxID=529605 RepID=A0AAV1DMY1_OLDCO|nr:OLC1v1007927C1 [Oldenlandia corymbosa var. corymbosa]
MTYSQEGKKKGRVDISSSTMSEAESASPNSDQLFDQICVEYSKLVQENGKSSLAGFCNSKRRLSAGSAHPGHQNSVCEGSKLILEKTQSSLLGLKIETRSLEILGFPEGAACPSLIQAHNREYPNPGNRGLAILRLQSTFRLCPSTAKSFDLCPSYLRVGPVRSRRRCSRNVCGRHVFFYRRPKKIFLDTVNPSFRILHSIPYCLFLIPKHESRSITTSAKSRNVYCNRSLLRRRFFAFSSLWTRALVDTGGEQAKRVVRNGKKDTTTSPLCWNYSKYFSWNSYRYVSWVQNVNISSLATEPARGLWILLSTLLSTPIGIDCMGSKDFRFPLSTGLPRSVYEFFRICRQQGLAPQPVYKPSKVGNVKEAGIGGDLSTASVYLLGVAGFFGRFLGSEGTAIMTTTCLSFSAILSLIAFYEVAPGASACYLKIAPWISSEMFDASWGFFGDS